MATPVNEWYFSGYDWYKMSFARRDMNMDVSNETMTAEDVSKETKRLMRGGEPVFSKREMKLLRKRELGMI